MTFTIVDSYRIRSRAEMRAQIEAHRLMNPHNLALQRGTSSLVREWCGHNLLHSLRIAQARTASVDFEAPQRWYISTVWLVLSCFYW